MGTTSRSADHQRLENSDKSQVTPPCVLFTPTMLSGATALTNEINLLAELSAALVMH